MGISKDWNDHHTNNSQVYHHHEDKYNQSLPYLEENSRERTWKKLR